MCIIDNHKEQLAFANELLDNNMARDAIRAFRKLERSKLRIDAGLGISSALDKKGKHYFSLIVLLALASEFPKDLRPRLRLANKSAENKDYQAAWHHLKSCFAINPDCIEGWEAAYICASQLNRHEAAEKIARKLIKYEPDSERYHELHAISLNQMHRPTESCKAYAEAYRRASSDVIYFINSRLPFYQIFPAGITPFMLASEVHAICSAIQQRLTSGQVWEIDFNRSLANSIFYTAYSPLNLRKIYEPYLATLSIFSDPLVAAAVEKSNEMAKRLASILGSSKIESSVKTDLPRTKIRIGLASSHFSSHSNTQAFEGFLKYLDRDLFCVVLIHLFETDCDDMQLRLNERADEVAYLSNSLWHSHFLISSLDLDILFFTDIGMSSYDFIIPALRACDIQITGWGLPHTTGLKTIDYYLSSSFLETKEHANEYTEKLVLLQGLPCCYLSESLHYQKKPKHYFMLPDDRVVIGCVQTLFKIHPDMDLILERIAKRMPEAVFAFVAYSEYLDSAFLARLEKRAPTAFQRTLLLSRCSSTDFLSMCDCLDILLDTPYYGAGVTAYMSTYVGTPMVCFSGTRLRDSTTAAIYRYLEIANAPIANSIPEYVDKVVELANDFDLRFQIKKDTVEAAHKLYDNQEYIRSFEKFCLDLIDKKRREGN